MAQRRIRAVRQFRQGLDRREADGAAAEEAEEEEAVAVAAVVGNEI
jgi:hypothetical protein